MTHTLHRAGSAESLSEDYVVLLLGEDGGCSNCSPKGLGAVSRMRAMLKAALSRLGVLERIRRLRRRPSGAPRRKLRRAKVLGSRDELKSYLTTLKEIDAGRPVVVSGVIDEVHACLEEIGLRPHTVQLSLGYFGKTELLPPEPVLEITTMCGHHMLTPRRVEELVDQIRRQRLTAGQAAESLARLCVCRVFNVARATRLLEGLARSLDCGKPARLERRITHETDVLNVSAFRTEGRGRA